MNLNNKHVVPASLLLAILVSAVVVWALSSTWQIGNISTIQTNGLWCDTTFLNWGLVNPNTNTTRTVVLRNIGNIEVTLEMATENWVPENVTDYTGFTWNYTGQMVQPDESLAVDLVLMVYANATQSGILDFSFDIIFSAIIP